MPAPANYSASKTDNSITLSWDTIWGADAYRVYKYNETKQEFEQYKNVSKNQCKITGLSSDTKYKFKVAALVKSGSKYKEQNSSTISVTTEKIWLSAPTNVKATSTSSSITLTWSAVSGAAAYRVYAGEIDQGDKVVAYIYEQGYDTVDYVVATHAHSDHIGGLQQVLTNFNVNEVIMTEDKNDTQIFNNLFTAIYVNGATLHYVMAGDTIISEGDLLVEVVAPKVLVPNDYNNNSVVIKITYGNTKFLFAGDAEKSEEDGIWTNIKCDLLKVGHHGSKSSSSANFLKKVNPTYAIISCGLYNSYGHPTDDVLQRLNDRKIKTYRTDLQGTIIATSDGQTITIDKDPVDYNQSVTTTTTEQSIVPVTDNSQETIYVLNTRYSCSYCNDIFAERYSCGSRIGNRWSYL